MVDDHDCGNGRGGEWGKEVNACSVSLLKGDRNLSLLPLRLNFLIYTLSVGSYKIDNLYEIYLIDTGRLKLPFLF